MSFRRFLYLVADDCLDRSYSLRRIDMSRLFFRASTEGTPAPLDNSGGAGAADPSAVDDGGCLPDPAINLSPPHLQHSVGTMEFMLFKNKAGNDGEEDNKVVAIDNTGKCLMVDPNLSPTVRALPSPASPKFAPCSLTVGQSLYAMDAFPVPPNNDRKQHSFEVLSNDAFRCKGWYWQPLDPPPNVYSSANRSHSIDSYTVVDGSNIVISNTASKLTYCFDTVKKTWDKAGNWVLPFSSLAEYIPKHKLWFGISPAKDGYRFSGANLTASFPDSEEMMLPDVHGFWKEYAEPPPEWSLAGSYAVHLGSSKLYLTRFFEIGKIHVCPESHKSYKREEELQVVLTGVEVESCGEELRVLKHKSERYKLDVRVDYQVL